MNTLQTALTWLGAISATGLLLTGTWITAVSVNDHRRIKANRANLRVQRKPLSEADIQAVDFDAELANLTKENGR